MFGEEARKAWWANGVREKMGWQNFGRRRMGSDRRKGIGVEGTRLGRRRIGSDRRKGIGGEGRGRGKERERSAKIGRGASVGRKTRGRK